MNKTKIKVGKYNALITKIIKNEGKITDYIYGENKQGEKYLLENVKELELNQVIEKILNDPTTEKEIESLNEIELGNYIVEKLSVNKKKYPLNNKNNHIQLDEKSEQTIRGANDEDLINPELGISYKEKDGKFSVLEYNNGHYDTSVKEKTYSNTNETQNIQVTTEVVEQVDNEEIVYTDGSIVYDQNGKQIGSVGVEYFYDYNEKLHNTLEPTKTVISNDLQKLVEKFNHYEGILTEEQQQLVNKYREKNMTKVLRKEETSPLNNSAFISIYVILIVISLIVSVATIIYLNK